MQSSDIYLLIIGDRPGSSPLGKPVIEEELDEARRRKLPRLMFLQNVSRDAETEALAQRLSGFVHGRFRTSFDTPADIRTGVGDALRTLSAMQIEKNDPSLIQELLQARTDDGRALIRIAVVPERKDEVFDVLDFDRSEFRRSIFQLAHRDDVQLLDFEQGPKSARVDDGELLVEQEPRRGNVPAIAVTIRVREVGGIVIDQTLSGRTRDRGNFNSDSQIPESDVSQAIGSAIAFVNGLYEQHDPGHRYATFHFGAAVAGMRMHVVVRERREQSSWSFPNFDDRDWFLLDKPRRVDRTDLANPQHVIERTLAFNRQTLRGSKMKDLAEDFTCLFCRTGMYRDVIDPKRDPHALHNQGFSGLG